MSISVCAVLLLTLGSLAFIDQGCSNPKTADSSMNVNVSGSAETGTDSSEMKGNKDSRIRFDAMGVALKRESLKLNLTNLKDAKLSNAESEMRIWVGFGLLYPRCFILRNVDGEKQAYYIAPHDIAFKADPDRALMTKIAVGPPRNGWPQFDALLKAEGFTAPIRLTLDDKDRADPDEEMLVVEVKSGSEYSVVFFPLYTESEDGRKTIALCTIIEQEFAIRMGCGKTNH